MAPNPLEPFEALGQRLSRQAMRLMWTHTPEFAWLAPVQDLLSHLQALPGPSAGRFDRIEAGGSTVVFHDRVVATDGTVGAGGQVSAGRELPSDVQAQLRRVIEHDASPVRIHDDAAADAIARAHRAEAVTIGRHVYFRRGRFRPHEPSGIGLVAHEATHVAELFTPGRAWRRLTGTGRDDEEHLAAANERRAFIDADDAVAPRKATPGPVAPRDGLAGPPAMAVLAAVTAQHGRAAPRRAVTAGDTAAWSDIAAPGDTAAAPTARPMAAAEDRTVAAPPSLDMDALRRSLFHDLKQQLQSEFERGA